MHGARSLFHQLYGQQPRASLYHLLLLLAGRTGCFPQSSLGTISQYQTIGLRCPGQPFSFLPPIFQIEKDKMDTSQHQPPRHELTVQGRQHPSLGASENENMCRLKHWMEAGQQTNQTAQARASTGAVGGKGLHSGGHNKNEVHCLQGHPLSPTDLTA